MAVSSLASFMLELWKRLCSYLRYAVLLASGIASNKIELDGFLSLVFL